MIAHCSISTIGASSNDPELSGHGIKAVGRTPELSPRRAILILSTIGALREGIDLGLILIDTAEMYAEGESERLVGEAIQGNRDQVFLVSRALSWPLF